MRGRFGNGHPSIVPYTAYPVADGTIAVAVGNDGQFAKFAVQLGKPEWATDARYARNPDRVANRVELDAAIAELLRSDAGDAWLAKLMEAGVPCGRINSVAEALSDPHTIARDMVCTVHHPREGDIKMVGIPFRFSATPASVRRPPPILGQHTEQVLRDVLGFSDTRIAELRAQKVI